jgi:AcrR family transcriptional regulator
VSIEPLTPERRRAMTREHLLRAAAEVFARDGFYGASLDEVAAAAGFTKGAVYSNFKSKEDLFLAVLDDRIERQMAAFTGAIGDGTRPPDITQPVIHGVIDRTWDESGSVLYLEFLVYASRHPEAQRKLAELQRRLDSAIAGLIAADYERSGTRPRYPVDVLATISHSLFEGLSLRRLVDPASVTPKTVDTVLGFLYETIGREAGDPDAREPDAGDADPG